MRNGPCDACGVYGAREDGWHLRHLHWRDPFGGIEFSTVDFGAMAAWFFQTLEMLIARYCTGLG